MTIYSNPTYNSTRDLIRPSDSVNYNLSFDEIESSIFNACQPYCEETISSYLDEVGRAKVKWACISSKTQRREEKIWNIIVSENLVEVHPHYSHVKGSKPPSRDETEISGFSKKSRYKMMKKIKTMKRKELSLPYFVTITYQDNEQDFKKVKRQLNTFLQRFRRIGTLRYMWKMEPQKRGAIHFHLMLFLPEEIYPEKYKDDDWARLEYIRMRISHAWNEVSEQSESFQIMRSKNGKVYGNMALYSGTNVRGVDSWRQAAGYLAKYMRKEIDGNSWKDKDTGRFWAVSNNFDFEPYYRHTVDMQEVEEIKLLLQEICSASFEEFKLFAKNRLKQLRGLKKSNPKKYKYAVLRLKEQLKNQRRRYAVNLEKIEKGASVQAELSHIVAREIVPESIHYN